MSKDTLSILRKGLERLQRRGGWTKGYFAYNERMDRVPSRAPEAVCWCAAGAIDCDDASMTELQATLGKHRSVVEFNDRQRDKRPVIRLYQRTIARLEKAGSE